MLRNRFILLLDLPLIAIAAAGAFALRFDLAFPYYRPEFTAFLVGAIVIKPVIYYAFGMYARYWRYGSAMDLVAIVVAVSASTVGMAVFVLIGRQTGLLHDFARAVILIDWLLTLALAGGLRMSVRIIGDLQEVRQKQPESAKAKKVLILGAGEAGVLVAREMKRNPQMGMTPVGFLDDAVAKLHKQVQGIPVLGDLSALEKVLTSDGIEDVVIAMPTAAGTVVRDAAEICRRVGIAPRVVPGVYELLDGKVSVSRLRKVEITDLLRRPQHAGRTAKVPYLEAKSVLVTGAGGSIGSELSRQVAFSNPKRLVLLGHGENSIFTVHNRLKDLYPKVELHPVIADIRDAARLESIFGRFKPDVVFHAAAHKHVPLMEANPEEAFTNNVLGTRNVLESTERSGAQRFVLISTDKAVSPSSIMGASKRLAETLVMSAGRRLKLPYVVVRFGNVLGSRGSVVPTLQAQIERGGPVTITHPDMKRYFMTIPEAVQLVLQAGGLGAAGDLFVLNMGQPHKILDLAKDLIRLSGADPDAVEIQVVGLRPGEKMEEVLWHPEAKVTLTANPDVFRVKEPDPTSGIDVSRLLEDLGSSIRSGQSGRVRVALELAVPSYGAFVAPLGDG